MRGRVSTSLKDHAAAPHEAHPRAMLASVQDEQQAEAEQLFWERAPIEDVALVAVRQRKRQRRGSHLGGSHLVDA